MRVTAEHWKAFLDLAEENSELITNRFNGANGRLKINELWKKTTNILNSLGYGSKSTEEWRRALTDWKCKTKAKWSKVHKEMVKTGGGEYKNIMLSDNEQRLLNLMGKKNVQGDPVKEIGLEQGESQPIEFVDHDYIVYDLENGVMYNSEENENLPSTSRKRIRDEIEPAASKKPNYKQKCLSQRRNDKFCNKLSDMQSDTMTILKEISANIKSIGDTFNQFLDIYKKTCEGGK
ncbi:uncharacterized protein LOC111691300 isoform X2 [Anoplophora glabripennis]|nr:uncharacterized protein LOC108905340 isoform X2 [Anoplophora glabripennis]XP_023310004.1 uncharacterized protein LOC111691427 isoform X2 [Anoplophora glabripennis]XP_023310406.1 uncharacterized protein LOC111691300 isoform X2 [Anoplophora glabripennis]